MQISAFHLRFTMGFPDDSIRENVLPAKRHFELVDLIRARGQMTVNELAGHFSVSGDTDAA